MAPAQYVYFSPFSMPADSDKVAATYTGNIPKCIPNGEYLLRIQQLGIHNPGSPPQFYISCAQVNVTGGGGKTPSPTVKIPGAFKATDPGYTANVSFLFAAEVPLNNVNVLHLDLQQL